MAKMLILVRHGKAQSRDLGLPDFERQLTGAGKRSLKAWLEKSARLAASEEARSFELWASPAARTMQTAQIVAAVWGKRIKGFPKKPESSNALYEGDSYALLDAVAQSSADAVVVCGHNPQIELLCAHLTGCDITFATGGVAALALGSSNREQQPARLLWFVQGPDSHKWKKHD